MRDNECKPIMNSYFGKQEMCFYEVVDSLFAFAADPQKTGLSVKMEDGHVTQIEVLHINGKVTVKMDDVDMGYFEPYTQQGYKCRFNQKYRVHIREGRTPNEAMMESICDNPLVRLHKAY